MNYEYLQNLKSNHLAIQLLNADNFAMIAGFFYHAFKSTSTQALKESEILTKLDDYLYALKRGYVDEATHWRYSSARDYEGIDGLIEVERFW